MGLMLVSVRFQNSGYYIPLRLEQHCPWCSRDSEWNHETRWGKPFSWCTSGKWEISDQKNDQNLHINDHFWFGDRRWLIYGLLLHDQNWSFLFWSFIACRLVINLVMYLVINLVIYLNQWPDIWPHLWPNYWPHDKL